jgi:hypothetical protein
LILICCALSAPGATRSSQTINATKTFAIKCFKQKLRLIEPQLFAFTALRRQGHSLLENGKRATSELAAIGPEWLAD